nr:hypothetical protein [Tanacetum cinerariifolium]
TSKQVPVAIIDCQLPFEYTIASRSTDVTVLVLRVEKKMYVTEQPIPPALTADSAANVLAEWNAVYDAHNEKLKSMFEKQTGVERFDLIQTFHACKQEEGKSVSQYVLKMEGYVKQLERLGYVLPQDLSVGLILNGLTSDFAGFVRNYNMHNMGKTIGELHAMLIKYEKGKGKGKGKGKDKSYVPKPKNPKPNAKEHLEKNDACHHYKDVGHWKRNCLVYLDVLTKNKKQVGSASNRVRAQVEAIGSYDLVLPNGLVICLDSCHYVPSITRSVVLVSRFVENRFVQCFTDYGILVSRNDVIYFNAIPRGKHNLDSTYLWHCRLALISKKHIGKKQHDGLLKSTDVESFDQCVSCLSGKMTRKSFPHRPERVTDLLGLIHTDVYGPLRHVSRQENQFRQTIKALRSDRGGKYISQEFKDYLKAYAIVQQLTLPYTPQHNGDYAIEAVARILNMVPTKKFDKIPYELWIHKGNDGLLFLLPPENKIVVARYAEFFKKNILSQGVSGRAGDLKEIQNKDTSPSEITSEVPIEVEGFEPPHEEEAPVCRSERPHRAPNRLCLNVEVEEHNLGDLNEPTNYKATMLDPKSNKWLDAMNAEMQSMKDNQVWFLIDLPPNAKGFTQTYEVNYEETFSLVADTRAIRILIAIIAFYDYEIWKIDVKTAFLNGYLDEDIYMMQPEGFIDPKHPRKTAVKTILKYLRNTKDMFLVYGGNPKAELRVDCYCDVGLEIDRDDIKSQTGYIFILNGGAVDWKSSKQSTTTMSAIEAEYITASEAGIEVVWIRKFISGLEDDKNATNPPQVPPTSQAPHTLSTIKLPILKKGNSPVQISSDTHGQIRVLPPKTAEEILARERERKARTTLLMAITKDHLAKFHKMTNAKEMWEAIKSKFSGNDESKKMQKYILKQQFEGFFVSNSEGLHKGYDRTKPGVDTLSFDDIYNNLKVFESDVKVSTTSFSSTQNVAFVSSESHNSTNEVSTAYGVFTGLQLDHEDLEQVDEFDLEEIDLKWQVAMISTRLKKFYKKTWRKLHFDAKEPVGFDKTKVECFNCHNTGHFTKECKSKGNQESRRRDAGNIRYKARDNRRRPAKQDEHKAMVTIDGEGVDWTGHAEDDIKDYALMAFNSSNSGSDTEAEAQLVRHKKNQLAYAEKISESDAKNNDIASCESNTSVETLESVPTPVESKPKVVSEPKVWYDAPIIKEYESKIDDEYVFKATVEQEKPIFSFINTVKHVKPPRQTVKDQDTCSQNPKVPKRD